MKSWTKQTSKEPEIPDCPVCLEENNRNPSLHPMHLDTEDWDEVSQEGKKYFIVAGMRVKHKDLYMTVPYFIPVDSRSGLAVSTAVFQLIDEIAACNQVQAFQGAKPPENPERPGY